MTTRDRTALTQQRVRELLMYDEQTGELRWRVRDRKRRTDVPAGMVVHNGYIRVRIDYVEYAAHRLIWLYVHGRFPSSQMDHVNGVRTDNRLCNLRESTHAQNQQNKRAWGKSGLLGVTQSEVDGVTYYRSQLTKNGKRLWHGNFKTAAEAHAAYIEQKRIHHEFFDERLDQTKESP